jgi:polyisoprenoid-binding protein YceI
VKPSTAALRALGLGILAAAAAGTSGAAEYVADPDHVSVHFAVGHFDVAYVRGRFAKIDAKIDYDPAGRTGRVVVTVDADSVDSGIRSLDAILRSPQFLDTASHPEVRFASERFVFDGERLVAVEGRLWLHGVERPLRLDAERFTCRTVAAGILRRPICGGAFRATLKRSEFGMTRFLPDVGDEVRLDVDVEASPR